MAGKVLGIPSRVLISHHLTTDWWAWGLIVPEEPASPCPPPTLEEFRARFPEFAELPDAPVQSAIVSASRWADTSWIAGNCTEALLWLTAHFIALQMHATANLPDIVEDGEGGSAIIAGGEVTGIAFEGMSVSFSASKFGRNGGRAAGTESAYDFESTPYGAYYKQLLKVNQPAVLIV